MKRSSSERPGAPFCHDLRRVVGGGTALDPEVVTALLSRRDDAVDTLGPRRREVLALNDDHRRMRAVVRYLMR